MSGANLAAMKTVPKLIPIAPNRQNTCAVVVTYFPDEGVADRLGLIRKQVDEVLVIDNASDEQAVAHLRAALQTPEVSLIQNAANLGIAAALSQGSRWAEEKGYSWVLFFDQDTIPFADMAESLAGAYQDFPFKERLAVVGSSHSPEVDVPVASTGCSWRLAETVITSGSLVSVEALRTTGLFRDEFFIDAVDFEFCLRTRFLGFEIIEVTVPVMQHFIGRPQNNQIMGKSIPTHEHVPLRWYYSTRNSVVLYREYIWRNPRWVFRSIYARMRGMALMLIFERSRVSKLKHIARGFVDGILGRMGSI